MEAIFFTRKVSDWLLNTGHAAILHIFEQVCNVINEHDQVLSIVTPEIGNGPFNLVIPNHRRFTACIDLKSAIFTKHPNETKTPTELHIGSLVIQTRSAALWNARPDWATLHTHREALLQQVARLSDYGSRRFHIRINLDISNSLSSSLAAARIPSAIAAAKRLAGLGQGLTPSGDDYMMGALYAAWIIHPHDVAGLLGREIASAAAHRTTSLSGAWLRAAGEGEAGAAWHTFLEALHYGEPTAIELQLTNILSIGATSGADALAGFMNTFSAYRELQKNHVLS